jgi:hypothetical protein
MKCKNQIHSEYVIIAFIVIVLLLSIFADFSILQLPAWILTKAEKNLLYTLFSVQASVAIISIAIIALITGFSTENMYGISVSNYIMKIKPCILKHKAVIILNLMSIVLNYFTISFSLYNTSVSIFIINIILTIKMIVDISEIFYGKQELQKDIKQYVIQHYSLGYLSELQRETNMAIESNNFLTVYNDINILTNIFQKELKKCTQCPDIVKL